MYLRETYAGPLRRTSRQVYFSPVQRTCMRRRTSAVFGTTDDKTCKLNPDDANVGVRLQCGLLPNSFERILRHEVFVLLSLISTQCNLVLQFPILHFPMQTVGLHFPVLHIQCTHEVESSHPTRAL